MQRVVREAVLAAAAVDAIATEEVLGSPTRRLGDSRARFDVDRAMVADATAHLVWKDCVARFSVVAVVAAVLAVVATRTPSKRRCRCAQW
jgi:hypothetical protein